MPIYSMRRLALPLALTAVAVFPAAASELGGSLASMKQQYDVAREQDVAFLRTPADVRAHIATQQLVHVESNADFIVNNVSYPYALPALKLFIERLASQYSAATGEQLVVTSLTRPTDHQPSNAHPLSVHPTGLAVDLRIPAPAAHRSWLESTLLSLEERGVLDVTRERNPPHYHVAVFPKQYQSYADALIAKERSAVAAAMRDTPTVTSASLGEGDALEDTSPVLLSAIAAAILGIGVVGAMRWRFSGS